MKVKCPICCIDVEFGIDFSVSYDPEIIQKCICINCNLVFANYSYDFIASNSYDYKEYFPIGEASLINFGRKYVPDMKRVLCLGSGGNQGQLDKHLPKTISLYYSDLKLINNCSNFISIDELPNCGINFDLICSRAVVEHLENPIHVFDMLKNLLSPNGIMIHSFPNVSVNSFNNDMIKIRSHINLFSNKSLIHMCNLLQLQLLEKDLLLMTGHTHPTYVFRNKI